MKLFVIKSLEIIIWIVFFLIIIAFNLVLPVFGIIPGLIVGALVTGVIFIIISINENLIAIREALTQDKPYTKYKNYRIYSMNKNSSQDKSSSQDKTSTQSNNYSQESPHSQYKDNFEKKNKTDDKENDNDDIIYL